MKEDAKDHAKKCVQCQKHGDAILQPAGHLKFIVAPWPFAQWGIDLVGPFPRSQSKKDFLIVATDYFSKWVEAKALRNTTSKTVKKFVWTHIFCRYGIPNAIVTDNGPQFASNEFQEFCELNSVKLKFASVEHPRCNGQVEATNKTVVKGIKKRLAKAKGNWPEELGHVLWSHRTMFKGATGETPYSLVYGVEAVIPVETAFVSHRVEQYDANNNEAELRRRLDLLEEKRERANMRNLEAKRCTANFYNKRVKDRSFKVGDKVWRIARGKRKKSEEGKLAANWQGPFVIKGTPYEGAYYLDDPKGPDVPRTWNVQSLKKYYE